MNNDLIVIDNSIVKSAYSLSLNELRLVFCALSKMPKGEPIAPQTPFYITSDDFIELGASPKNVARDIRTATSYLMKRTCIIPINSGNLEFSWLSEAMRYDSEAERKLREKYPNPEDHRKYINGLRLYHLYDSLPPHKDDDNIVARIIFNERMLPFLSDLKECFTQIMLDDIRRFNSAYSHRIFMLMMSFKSTGWVEISLKELRFMLVLNDKYKQTRDLIKRVIDVAIRDINEKSPYDVDYKLIKKGRKFTDLELKFKPKPKDVTETSTTDNRDPNTLDWIDNLTDTERKIIREQAEQYISKQGITDESYKQNIYKKALAENWGLADYQKEQVEEEKRKKRLQEEKQKELERKKAEEEKQKLEQKELDECEMKFLALPQVMQNIVLENLENRLPKTFRKRFRTDLEEDSKAYRLVEYAGTFKQIMKDF